MQVLTWGPPEQTDLKQKIVRWTVAMVYALKAHMRRSRNMTKDLEVRSISRNSGEIWRHRWIDCGAVL